MSRSTVTYIHCDYCMRKANEHVAYRTFGYISDGAGLMTDFCDSPECVAHAQEVACNRPYAQIFYPRTTNPEGQTS